MKRIVADIGDHLMDRVQQLIADTVDTCGRADLTLNESRAMVCGVMSVSFAETCSGFGMSREAYLQLAALAYEGREPKPRRRVARRK
jgi:hypothetical protein